MASLEFEIKKLTEAVVALTERLPVGSAPTEAVEEAEKPKSKPKKSKPEPEPEDEAPTANEDEARAAAAGAIQAGVERSEIKNMITDLGGKTIKDLTPEAMAELVASLTAMTKNKKGEEL